jgi:sulfoxide reductase heme-binding subunit YedZ
MVRRLGGKRWQRLHRAVYAIAVLGVLHFWWLVKKDITEPLVFGALLGLLLLIRLIFAARKAGASTRPAGARSQAA